jgi:hypothetical protein
VGAALVAVSGFLPWVQVAGRSRSGFRSAALVIAIGDDYQIGPPSWTGIAWFVLPLIAALAWLWLFFWAPVGPRRAHRWMAVTLLGAVSFCAIEAARHGSMQLGLLAALAGSALIGIGAFWPRSN